MTASFIIQVTLVILLSLLVAYPLGLYLAKVFDGKNTKLDPFFLAFERPLLRLLGIRGEAPAMDWKQYTLAMLWSNLLMVLLMFGILVYQGRLPLNPLKLA